MSDHWMVGPGAVTGDVFPPEVDEDELRAACLRVQNNIVEEMVAVTMREKFAPHILETRQHRRTPGGFCVFNLYRVSRVSRLREGAREVARLLKLRLGPRNFDAVVALGCGTFDIGREYADVCAGSDGWAVEVYRLSRNQGDWQLESLENPGNNDDQWAPVPDLSFLKGKNLLVLADVANRRHGALESGRQWIQDRGAGSVTPAAIVINESIARDPSCDFIGLLPAKLDQYWDCPKCKSGKNKPDRDTADLEAGTGSLSALLRNPSQQPIVRCVERARLERALFLHILGKNFDPCQLFFFDRWEMLQSKKLWAHIQKEVAAQILAMDPKLLSSLADRTFVTLTDWEKDEATLKYARTVRRNLRKRSGKKMEVVTLRSDSLEVSRKDAKKLFGRKVVVCAFAARSGRTLRRCLRKLRSEFRVRPAVLLLFNRMDKQKHGDLNQEVDFISDVFRVFGESSKGSQTCPKCRLTHRLSELKGLDIDILLEYSAALEKPRVGWPQVQEESDADVQPDLPGFIPASDYEIEKAVREINTLPPGAVATLMNHLCSGYRELGYKDLSFPELTDRRYMGIRPDRKAAMFLGMTEQFLMQRRIKRAACRFIQDRRTTLAWAAYVGEVYLKLGYTHWLEDFENRIISRARAISSRKIWQVLAHAEYEWARANKKGCAVVAERLERLSQASARRCEANCLALKELARQFAYDARGGSDFHEEQPAPHPGPKQEKLVGV